MHVLGHDAPSTRARVQGGGRVFCYSADTAPCEALLRLAQDADVFLCEASYMDGVENPPDLHLTGREAGEAATKAGAGAAAAHPSRTGLGQRVADGGGGGRGVRRAAGRGGPGACYDV